MLSEKKKPRKWIYIGSLVLLLPFLLLMADCHFAYQWSGTYPDYWNMQWYEKLSHAFHQKHMYQTKEQYLTALGSPDGTAESLMQTYDGIDPEQYHVSDHRFRQVSVPECGLFLRQHRYANGFAFVPNQFVITSDHFTFGPLHIGVGSPKWLVKLAYLADVKLTPGAACYYLLCDYRLFPEERAEEFDLGYRIGVIDSDYRSTEVSFRFDEKNRVDMMVITFVYDRYR